MAKPSTKAVLYKQRAQALSWEGLLTLWQGIKEGKTSNWDPGKVGETQLPRALIDKGRAMPKRTLDDLLTQGGQVQRGVVGLTAMLSSEDCERLRAGPQLARLVEIIEQLRDQARQQGGIQEHAG